MIIITLNYVLYLLGVVGLELFLSMSIGDDVAVFKKIKMLLVLSTCVMYGDAFSYAIFRNKTKLVLTF